VFQLNVKSMFLNGDLGEEVYFQQLLRYELKGEEDKVYRLYKALLWVKTGSKSVEP